MPKFFDMVGNEIEVGDFVAVAGTVNQSGELRTGTIIELIEKSIKIRTRWHWGFGCSGNTQATLMGGRNKWELTGGRDAHGHPEMRKTGDFHFQNFLCLDKDLKRP